MAGWAKQILRLAAAVFICVSLFELWSGAEAQRYLMNDESGLVTTGTRRQMANRAPSGHEAGSISQDDAMMNNRRRKKSGSWKNKSKQSRGKRTSKKGGGGGKGKGGGGKKGGKGRRPRQMRMKFNVKG